MERKRFLAVVMTVMMVISMIPSMVFAAAIDNCIIPKANIAEGRIMNNINIYGVETLSQTIEILKNIAVIDGSRKKIKQADVKSGECNKSDGNINNDTYNVLERSRVKFTYGSEVNNNNHSCSCQFLPL